MIAKLKKADIVQFKAKDIFRASQLSLLGISNSRVENDREKIRKRKELSPLLLIRDEQHGKVVIADDYHRCVQYMGSMKIFRFNARSFEKKTQYGTQWDPI